MVLFRSDTQICLFLERPPCILSCPFRLQLESLSLILPSFLSVIYRRCEPGLAYYNETTTSLNWSKCAYERREGWYGYANRKKASRSLLLCIGNEHRQTNIAVEAGTYLTHYDFLVLEEKECLAIGPCSIPKDRHFFFSSDSSSPKLRRRSLWLTSNSIILLS